MRKYIAMVVFAIAWVLAVALIFLHLWGGGSSAERTVELAGHTVYVTVADTEAEREQGLGGRSGLDEDEGMLFIFDEDGQWGFWMKDVSFAIDIVWLDSSGKIVYIAENVGPETYPQVFTSSEAARYVIELPAGWAKEYNLQNGDIVRL